MTRILVVLLIAWTPMVAQAAAEPEPASGSTSAPSSKPGQTAPAPARHGAGERPSVEDDELIRNLDLIQNLDLLDTVEVLGALNTPDTPEEEF